MYRISLDVRIENCKNINDVFNFIKNFSENYPETEIVSTKIYQSFFDVDEDDYEEDDDLDFNEDGNKND